MDMWGIDPDQPIRYKHASFRYFEENEHHVTRFCRDNVLLLVWEGRLRFSEGGEACEVGAGEYYIQRKDCMQEGLLPSDAPKYLYVHFDAEWGEGQSVLPYRGSFSHARLRELMERTDAAAHGACSLAERQHLLLSLLLSLRAPMRDRGLAGRIVDYLEEDPLRVERLEDLCEVFHYSKNYILRVFKQETGVTPFVYLNRLRLRRACSLLETTSSPIETVAQACGYRTYSHFYRAFLREYGTSPAGWRRRVRENPVFDGAEKSLST